MCRKLWMVIKSRDPDGFSLAFSQICRDIIKEGRHEGWLNFILHKAMQYEVSRFDVLAWHF